jgi:hypothetical protein
VAIGSSSATSSVHVRGLTPKFSRMRRARNSPPRQNLAPHVGCNATLGGLAQKYTYGFKPNTRVPAVSGESWWYAPTDTRICSLVGNSYFVSVVRRLGRSRLLVTFP